MANILYRGSTPSAANASTGGVNRPLSNEEIDKNFYALNASKLESSDPTLSTVTTNGSSTSVNLTLSGNNILGNGSTSVTTIRGTLKGSADSSFNLYGGDITSTSSYTTTISGGNRTAASSMGDGGGTLIVKAGDVSVGNGYNSGGDLYLYGGDISGSYTLPGSPEGNGGDVHIVSGSNLSTASVQKSSGDIFIDVADVGANGTRERGVIRIGTGFGYRPNVSSYSSATIEMGTSSGAMFVSCPTRYLGSSVTMEVDTRLQFLDQNAFPGSTVTWFMKYYGGDLAVGRYPNGGGTFVYPFTFSANNTFSTTGNLVAGGQVRATGDIIAYYTSDETLKTNIVKIDSALAKVNSLDGITFNWNEQAKEKFEKELDVREAGVIAQQVKAVLPEVVKTREDGTLAVKYEQMVPLLIEAIKELTSKVEDLQNQLNNK
jgi:hypothetical protein